MTQPTNHSNHPKHSQHPKHSRLPVRPFDPEEMAFRGRIGAYRLHATHDPREITQKARDAFLHRFEEEIDPDRTLPEEERIPRAAYAWRAYFARLALACARARRPRRTIREWRSSYGDTAGSTISDGSDWMAA